MSEKVHFDYKLIPSNIKYILYCSFMEKVMYLSYDLGFQGDYSNLYEWLDSHSAKECGDSFCRFMFDFKSTDKMNSDEDTKAVIEELRNDISSKIKLSNTDRIYVISDFFHKGETHMAGIFLFGHRKQSNPWDGASKSGVQQGFDE